MSGANTAEPPASGSAPAVNDKSKAAVEAIPDAPTEELGYKTQLDKKALEHKFPEKIPEPDPPHPVVQTINEYTPALGKMLGVDQKEEKKKPEERQNKPDGPPDRPVHDEQVKEFVRDQHRSRPEDAVVEE